MTIQLRLLQISLTALVAMFLLTFGARSWAQQVPHVLVVGPTDNYGALIGGLNQSLNSAGFTDSSHIRMYLRRADSPDAARAAIAGVIGPDVNAIVTIFGPSTQAASAATTEIPIIFCPVADPVAAKFAASYETPGGNLTGVASADAEASRRRLPAFRQVLPGLKRLAVLFDSGFPPDRVQIKNLEQIAPSTSVTLVSRSFDDESAAVTTLRALGRNDADAIFILKDSFLRSAGEELKRAAMEQKLPILVGDPDLVTFPGVVAAVGPNQEKLGRICGQMTARILKGAKPGNLPVQHPVFELLVNLKSAGRLGLVVPEPAIKQAVQVIR